MTVWDVDWLGDQYWNQHQRILRYSGDHNETWGGVTINIDVTSLMGLWQCQIWKIRPAGHYLQCCWHGWDQPLVQNACDGHPDSLELGTA